jgi:ParB-like chromosome segregation protein Spo0J
MKYLKRFPVPTGAFLETPDGQPHITLLETSKIEAGERILPTDPKIVTRLVESYSQTKQMTPLWVRMISPGKLAVVTGANRLEMAHELQLERVPSVPIQCTDEEAVELEIRENLNRRQLRGEERRLLYNKLVELRGVKAAQSSRPSDDEQSSDEVREIPSALPDEQPSDEAREDSPNVQPNDKGIRAVAREVGVDPKDIRQAVKIETEATPEAKDAARRAGVIDNNSAMLEVASAPPTEQVAKVAEIMARKATRKTPAERRRRSPEPPPADDPAPAVDRRDLVAGDVDEAAELLVRALGDDLPTFVRLLDHIVAADKTNELADALKARLPSPEAEAA